MQEKTAILLLNLGGPDSLQAVKPFLYNLFSDPDIFDVLSLPPWLVQKPFAWLVSTFRQNLVRHYYEQIGGRSPILSLTQAQGEALKETVKTQTGMALDVYIGMRYWHPYIEDTVNQILQDGVTHLVVLPMFPQFSLTTTGSSLNELQRCLKEKQANIRLSVIEQYHTHPDYQAALAAVTEEALDHTRWSCPTEDVLILFSAHSLPKGFVEKSGDVYPDQIHETATMLMARYFPNHPWQICYQSKIGNIPWLEPSTDDALRELSAKNCDNILIIPVSFVSDHIETLYEIDLLYLPLARDLQIPHCRRVKAFNTHPRFIEALSALALDKMDLPCGISP